MTVTNPQSGTNVHEIADGIYRINTPIALPGDVGKFSFNQYLIDDDEPLLFHTGLRQLLRWCTKRWPACCRWRGCATSRSRMSRPTNAARSTVDQLLSLVIPAKAGIQGLQFLNE